MKRIYLLIVILTVFSSSLFAGRYRTGLSVSVLANYPVRILINGIVYNGSQPGDADLFLDHLRPGYHQVQIVRRGRSGRHSTPYTPGSAIYQGTVFLRPGFHLDLVINRFGRAFMDEVALSGIGGLYYGYGGGQGTGLMTCMDNSRFDQMKNTLRNIAFEDTRLGTCKQMMDNGNFSSSQIRELMQLFSFETNKLELAKAAYSRTVDPENFFNTYDAFSFNSSRDEMNQFIQDAR